MVSDDSGMRPHDVEPDSSLESARPLVSIVVPVFNEANNVTWLHQEVTRVFSSLAAEYDYEIVFTDNHSVDNTFERLAEMGARDPHIRVIRFSRNFGFNCSVMTGYRMSRGDAAIQIDCDLQDPPDMFIEFLRLWRAGHDVVVGVRRKRDEGRFRQFQRRVFYRLMDKLTNENLVVDSGDFRLIDRSIIDQLRWIDDVNPFTRGLTSSLASNQIGVLYDRRARQFDKSKYPFRRLFGLALDGVIAHSVLPLRIASFIGLAIAFGAVILSVSYIIGRLFFEGAWPSGFATIAVLLLFGIGLNAIFLGIIGEYLGRIYLQVRHRPLTVIEKTVNCNGDDFSSEQLRHYTNSTSMSGRREPAA
jgi:polyisoprenyl-phosphate glycosyltransferase